MYRPMFSFFQPSHLEVFGGIEAYPAGSMWGVGLRAQGLGLRHA